MKYNFVVLSWRHVPSFPETEKYIFWRDEIVYLFCQWERLFAYGFLLKCIHHKSVHEQEELSLKTEIITDTWINFMKQLSKYRGFKVAKKNKKNSWSTPDQMNNFIGLKCKYKYIFSMSLILICIYIFYVFYFNLYWHNVKVVCQSLEDDDASMKLKFKWSTISAHQHSKIKSKYNIKIRSCGS